MKFEKSVSKMSTNIKCNMCPYIFVSNCGEIYYDHVKSVHRSTTNKFYTVCLVCGKPFYNFVTFKRHWYRKHKCLTDNSNFSLTNNINSSNVEVDMNNATLIGDISCNTDVNNIFEMTDVTQDDNLAECQNNLDVLEFRNEQPNNIVQNCKQFLSSTLLVLHNKYFLPFEGLEYTQNAMIEFAEKLNLHRTASDVLKNSIERGMTRHEIEKSWAKFFPAVLPITVQVNHVDHDNRSNLTWSSKGDQTTLVKNEEKLTGQIVPFKLALQQILSIQSVYDAVQINFKKNRQKLHSEIKQYEDVWDSELIRKNPVYREQNGAVLGIQIFYDDVELANPLGSKKGIHKMAVFYWTLLNLPPECRSSLRSIQLLAVIPTKYLRKYSPKVFLASGIDELRQLEKGMTLTIGNQTSIWYGIVVNNVGDMLASNYLGGFKESPAMASSPCRICHIRRNDLDNIHDEGDCDSRDKLLHETMIDAMENESDKKKKSEISKQHGIVSRCCFNSLSYFDATKHFPHDIMHVLYEGVLNYECVLLLNHLVTEGKIDIDSLNRSIRKFKSCREFVTPPLLRREDIQFIRKIPYSSSEMQSLCCILPIILSKTTSFSDDSKYSNFLILLEIAANLQCFSFTEDEINNLRYLINIHNSSFVSLYAKQLAEKRKQGSMNHQKNCAITPKLHSLIHFPSSIKQHGPPRCYWSYRYEAKNATLKKVMRRNCNYSNVPFTIATHVQKLAALDIHNEGASDFFSVECRATQLKDINSKKSEHLPFLELMRKSAVVQCETNFKYVCSALTFTTAGRKCKPGAVFLKTLPNYKTNNELSTFWKLACIYVYEQEIILIMETMKTLYFDYNSFSFLLKESKSYEVVYANNMPYNVPLQAFKYEGNFHVVPNYYHLL